MKKGAEIAVVKGDTGLANEDWYQQLVEDCRAIKTERTFNAAVELIQGNWELGQRISKENDNMERSKVYGKKIIPSLAVDIGKSPAHLWKCVQVYQYYKEEHGVDDFDALITKLPEGKNVTWTMTVDSAGIEKEQTAIKEKTTFKLDSIIASFKIWLVSTGVVENEQLEQAISDFREHLVNHGE